MRKSLSNSVLFIFRSFEAVIGIGIGIWCFGDAQKDTLDIYQFEHIIYILYTIIYYSVLYILYSTLSIYYV